MGQILIGGNGYRWRGKNIRSIVKNGITHITLPRNDSMILAVCSVKPKTNYRVSVLGCRASGNGALLVNFFADVKCDGKPVSINVTSTEISEYSAIVTTPNFSRGVQMNLRIFRPNNASGNVTIKLIRFDEILKKDTNVKSRPIVQPAPLVSKIKPSTIARQQENSLSAKEALLRRRETIKSKRKKIRVPVIRQSKDVKPVKYKPYIEFKKSLNVEKVFVDKPSDLPKVSIITPTRDNIELLKNCYEAIKTNTHYLNWEWIIGDSDSLDGTAAMVKSWNDPRVKLVERGTIEGSFSSINNELVKYSDGQYLVFLNDDTRPQPYWLYVMMSKIYRHNEVGIVGARLMYNENKVQHAGIAFIPQGPANIGKAVLKSFPKGFEKQDRYFQAVTGACLLMSRVDFDEVGGFDPIYYFCYEDVDLCLKVQHKLNKRVLYAANAVVIHAESVTQRKHKTSGVLQQAGIKVFKERWMGKVDLDFTKYQKLEAKGKQIPDISFVTCVSNVEQYTKFVVGSLFKSTTKKKYEIIPVFNFGNPYSAAQALNIGINKARADLVVLCHQDVLFYQGWIDMLYERIAEIEQRTKKWGILGTAGISARDDTVGVVYNMKGRLQWQSTKKGKFYPIQTVDEHCMIMKKSNNLRFDEKTFTGFHMYGCDLVINARHMGFENFGILCPLVHASGSGSMDSGKAEYMKYLKALADKWTPIYQRIRLPTAMIRKGQIKTFLKFGRGK